MKTGFITATLLTLSLPVLAQSVEDEATAAFLNEETETQIEAQAEQAPSDMAAPENAGQEAPSQKASVDEFIAMMLFEEMMLAARKLYLGEEEVITSADYYRHFGYDSVPVSLAELQKTIESNELAAELAYDKPFVTTGKIEQITRVMGTPLVKLRPGGKNTSLISSVGARFDSKYTPQLAKLEKGKVLTVRCTSWRYSMTVSISDCQLMPAFYDDYTDTIDPREITRQACENLKTYPLLFQSKIGPELDAVDSDIMDIAIEHVKNSEVFSYSGIGENIWGMEKYKSIQTISKDMIDQLVELKRNGTEIENCQ